MRTQIILILATALAAFGQEGGRVEDLGEGLRIAVVQQDSNPGKPEENRNKALRFARQALEQGAEVILFHEEMLVGCVTNLNDGDFPEMTRAYANLGCSMLFWMNNRPSRGHAEVRDLAYRNSMIMAMVSRPAAGFVSVA